MTASSLAVRHLNAAYSEVEKIIKVSSKTFYFATNLLPREERRAVRALYAFCRTTDDMVDSKDASLAELEDWRKSVRRPAFDQKDPVLVCWAQTREKYSINSRYEDELIDGVCADIKFPHYETWEELEEYCYLVASTVGLLSTPIIGLAKNVKLEDAEPYAIKLGIALQLTNILRDVGEDADRGRVYLPEEDLRKFGLTNQDILDRVYDDRFVALMRYEIKRARQLYIESLPGIAMLSPSARPAVGVAALLYRAILDEIEAIQYQTHIKRAYVSGKKKLALLPRFLWQIIRLKPEPECATC